MESPTNLDEKLEIVIIGLRRRALGLLALAPSDQIDTLQSFSIHQDRNEIVVNQFLQETKRQKAWKLLQMWLWRLARKKPKAIVKAAMEASDSVSA
ncbi:hypothetical protein NL676_030120 [Syzygium grande]|nr:hypothetical protein NL676_030120 [Syzygium grande]